MLNVTLTSTDPEIGSGTTASWELRVHNPNVTAKTAVISLPLHSSLESSRAWTSPTLSGVSGNDASGSGALTDTVVIQPGKTVVYYGVSTIAALGSQVVKSISLKASVTASSHTDVAILRIVQGDPKALRIPSGKVDGQSIIDCLFELKETDVEVLDFIENNGGRTIKDVLAFIKAALDDSDIEAASW